MPNSFSNKGTNMPNGNKVIVDRRGLTGNRNHLRWRLTVSSWRRWFMDAVAWGLGLLAAAFLRFDFSMKSVDVRILLLIGLVVVVQLFGGIIGWLYQGRYYAGSLEEFAALAWVMTVETIGLGLVCVLVANELDLPRSLVFIAAPITMVLMLAGRYVRRLLADREHQSSSAGRRALIIGAGSLGRITLQRMVTDARSPYAPVGLLDDDPNKANLSIRGVEVLGRVDDLPVVAKQVRASVLVVAIADVDPKLMSRVMRLASPLEMDVKVVPTLEKSLGGQAWVGPVRDVAIEDLIERPPINLDIESIAKYLNKRRVLVTGAGGSIGKELCAQINKYGPSNIIMLDHDETHLQDTEFELYGTGLLVLPEIVLADIRDKEAIDRIFAQWKPEVVFHAAALKHVPMLQRHPHEAWDTNVMGTLNVMQAARAAGTEVFVNISTDKAADPTTILGHSKRLGECLTSWMGQETGMRYCSVRFGNVFGSRGSMVPLFQKMIEAGMTITVTHEDATRYFMTIPEACQLVVQAGAIGTGGDVMILDMGSPIKILDIVQRLMEISGKDAKVKFTGLREGEKVAEVLVSDDESGRLSHPVDRTIRASVPPLHPESLDYDTWVTMVEYGGGVWEDSMLDKVRWSSDQHSQSVSDLVATGERTVGDT